jgi:diguanylate cyclase (GGDEF)-like protein/PAS domain S-box-containing protein
MRLLGGKVKYWRPHILVAGALVLILAAGWHGALRNALLDLRFAGGSRQSTGDIVVVAIDTRSIEDIGVWPWPRRLHADLLRRLTAAGVRDVVFDVDFSTPSDRASDRELVGALAEAGGSVVLPSFKQPGAAAGDPASVHINRPLKQVADQAWSAMVNVQVEADGLVRRYPFGELLEGEFLPSMSAVLAGQYRRGEPPFLIDFSVRPESIPMVSYADVLRGDPSTLGRLRDKKVIVGGTALELGDRFSIPNGRVVSGPLLQALAAESILQQRVLRWTSDVVTAVGLCLLVLTMMISWRRLSAGARVAVLASMAVASEGAAILLQANSPFVLDTSLFHAAIIGYMAAIALDEIDFRGLLRRIAENRFQRIAMALGDGLVCTDQDHLITVWNPGAEAIFGYDAADMIGRPFDTICAANEDAKSAPFSIRQATRPAALLSAGAVIEFNGRRKNGEVFPVEACFSGWQGTEGLQYGAILRDISIRKREAERIKYLAEHDTLTGLINRNALHDVLEAMITEAGPSGVALLVLGLDGFQRINDVLGHANGDLVLSAVAERLRAEAKTGLVARLSGDEFAIAVQCEPIDGSIAGLSERLAAAFDRPLQAGTRQHRVRISIGVAAYPEGGRTADELLSNSHLALCRAKACRRGAHVVFESSIREELESRLALEAGLALAIERDEFELFYQPQVRLLDGAIIGAEALIRWRHPERGIVAPGEFMPVVNTSPISDKIAGWVLRTACQQARAWEIAGCGVRVGINLSPSQVQSGDLAEVIAQTLDETGLTPSLLEIEVTEDILLQDEEKVFESFKKIQELGVRIVFDDFGTGYASLSYVKKFPLDGLKVDRSFVRDLLFDSDDAAIVSSTIGLSKQLGLSVIAEGIENRATADLLLSMGCSEGQGYFFDRPMPVADFERRLVLRSDSESAEAGQAA